MVPTGLVSGAIVLSLIPAWLFLLRTENVRRPREHSAVEEVLQLATVGLLTTGVACGVVALLWPGAFLIYRSGLTTAHEVRQSVGLFAAILVGSCLLAELAAYRMRSQSSTPDSEVTISVWWSALRPELVPDDHLPWATVALTDDSIMQGVLHNYTLSSDSTHRDIALLAPITISTDGVVVDTRYSFTVIPADQIKHLSVSYMPRSTPQPGSEQTAAE